MKFLSDVSETAIITLKSRVIESQKEAPVFFDPVSVQLFEKMEVVFKDTPLQTRMEKDLPGTLTRHIALRARKYDSETLDFIRSTSNPLVVNLGSGFDTRFWRLQTEKNWQYLEVDLPGVIEAKQNLFKNDLPYSTISASVLENDWIEEILKIQNQAVLFLAEGLFMYLPQQEVQDLFKKLSEKFSHSAIIFETVTKKYTQGLWKKMVEMKMKNSLDSGAGSSYQFGLSRAKEIESFGQNIKVLDEWSYFEDPDIEPKLLYAFRNWKFFTRTQWTIKAGFGQAL